MWQHHVALSGLGAVYVVFHDSFSFGLPGLAIQVPAEISQCPASPVQPEDRDVPQSQQRAGATSSTGEPVPALLAQPARVTRNCVTAQGPAAWLGVQGLSPQPHKPYSRDRETLPGRRVNRRPHLVWSCTLASAPGGWAVITV